MRCRMDDGTLPATGSATDGVASSPSSTLQPFSLDACSSSLSSSTSSSLAPCSQRRRLRSAAAIRCCSAAGRRPATRKQSMPTAVPGRNPLHSRIDAAKVAIGKGPSGGQAARAVQTRQLFPTFRTRLGSLCFTPRLRHASHVHAGRRRQARLHAQGTATRPARQGSHCGARRPIGGEKNAARSASAPVSRQGEVHRGSRLYSLFQQSHGGDNVSMVINGTS